MSTLFDASLLLLLLLLLLFIIISAKSFENVHWFIGDITAVNPSLLPVIN